MKPIIKHGWYSGASHHMQNSPLRYWTKESTGCQIVWDGESHFYIARVTGSLKDAWYLYCSLIQWPDPQSDNLLSKNRYSLRDAKIVLDVANIVFMLDI